MHSPRRPGNQASNGNVSVLNQHSPPNHRRHELGEVPARRERFFAISNRWYFSTREGFDSGPYATQQRAASGLRRFLEVVQLLPDTAKPRR